MISRWECSQQRNNKQVELYLSILGDVQANIRVTTCACTKLLYSETFMLIRIVFANAVKQRFWNKAMCFKALATGGEQPSLSTPHSSLLGGNQLAAFVQTAKSDDLDVNVRVRKWRLYIIFTMTCVMTCVICSLVRSAAPNGDGFCGRKVAHHLRSYVGYIIF